MGSRAAVMADTSGLYALLDADDRFHELAARAWIRLLEAEWIIVVHHFVVLEVWSLLQSRLGMTAVEVFHREFWPLFDLEPLTEGLLARGVARCLGAKRRELSLTDCVSLELAAEMGLDRAFAFDRHFREAGLLLPDDTSWME
jgi:predicted nucleic acid-binding protein